MMAVKGPLKEVTYEWWTPGGGKKECLECGHVINAPADRSGPTNARRRRCWKCRQEAQTYEAREKREEVRA